MKHLAILGASGHGKVVADTAIQTGLWNKISFFDDAWIDRKKNSIWDVVGDTTCLLQSLKDFDGVIIAIGNNKIRAEKQQLLTSHQAKFVTIIHPYAFVSPNSHIESGSVVFAKAVINIDSRIGKGCIINTGATVDHDCLLSDFSHICPGVNLAGNVSIGTRSWIGIGATIIQGITVGDDVMVGAGSSVIKNIADLVTVAGVPAIPL